MIFNEISSTIVSNVLLLKLQKLNFVLGSEKKSDFDMIMESIILMKLDSLEHNISTTYRLARDWALKLGEDEASLEKKGLSAEVYAKLLELSKGETHPETIQARMEVERRR